MATITFSAGNAEDRNASDPCNFIIIPLRKFVSKASLYLTFKLRFLILLASLSPASATFSLLICMAKPLRHVLQRSHLLCPHLPSWRAPFTASLPSAAPLSAPYGRVLLRPAAAQAATIRYHRVISGDGFFWLPSCAPRAVGSPRGPRDGHRCPPECISPAQRRMG